MKYYYLEMYFKPNYSPLNNCLLKYFPILHLIISDFKTIKISFLAQEIEKCVLRIN